jgi:outer membrane protease
MKKTTLFVFLLLCAYTIGALEEGKGAYAFSFSTEAGMIYGTSYEIIYKAAGSSRYGSELQWNIKPLFFTGISAEYGPRDPFKKYAFFGRMNLKAGIPTDTGTIEDRDWLEPTTVPGSLTLFSSHENQTRIAILADLEGGLTLPVTRNLLVKFLLGITYMYFKYEAWNGYTQYGTNAHYPSQSNPYTPWDPNWPKDYTLKGELIDYAQHWFVIRPGLELTLQLRQWFFGFTISVSPLAGCYAIDNHYMRTPPFQVKTDQFGGLFIEPKGDITFKLNKKISVGLSVSYRYIGETEGNLEMSEYYTAGTVTRNVNDIAGARYEAITGSIGVTYTF